MITRPDGVGAFEFAVLASLRAAQLCRGCVPRVEGGHCVAVTAQLEVADGAISLHDPGVATVAEAPPSAAPLTAASV